MPALSRPQRIVRWCRFHPKTSGIGALLLVAIVAANVLTDTPDDERNDAGPSRTTSAAPSSTSSAPTASTAPSATASPVSVAPADRSERSGVLATTALATLAVKGRAAKTGYTRAQFGDAWTDDNDNPLGRNGCDTRNDVLRRDLVAVSIKSDSDGCKVLAGTLRDPYTNTTIAFRRGVSTSADVQIDHVVALSDAWQKGAQRYDARTRANFGNDPLNLLAVDGPTNSAKGDGDAATWLPPNRAYRCAYVARQIAVKARYRLWMTAAEHDAAARVLTACPTQTVPAEAGAARLTPASKPTPATTVPRVPTTPAAPRTTAAPPADVYYENCTAVRAAGADPIRVGDPGYGSHLDRDGDGIACE